MRKSLIYLLLFALLTACSSGQKAMKKGNNYDAVIKALDRLQKKSGDEKAQGVLTSAYPLFVIESEQKLNTFSNSRNPLKWEQVQGQYERLDKVYKRIQLIPIATSLLPNAKSYSFEIRETAEKIVEARYALGKDQLKNEGRNGAIAAHQHFSFILNQRRSYKDTKALLMQAKELATIIVGLYPIPMDHLAYKLSADFFEAQLYEYVKQYNWNPFIEFVLPSNTRFDNIPKNHVVEIRFDEFTIGNSHVKETIFNRQQDSVITKAIVVGDSTVTAYLGAEAEVHCFSKEISSNGVLDIKIIDTFNGAIITNEKFEGTHLYLSNWGTFNGQKEALTKEDEECTKNRREVKDPSSQVLFTEMTVPLFDQVTDFLRDFYKRY